MTKPDDTSDVYPTDPDVSLSHWKPTPSRRKQILEAAADDPDFQTLTNMLCSLEGVSVLVDDRDEAWRPTTLILECHDDRWHSSRDTSDLLTICRRAGWRLESVTFGVRKRLVFELAGEYKSP